MGTDQIFHDWAISELLYQVAVFDQVVWLGERGHWEHGLPTDRGESGERDGAGQQTDLTD